MNAESTNENSLPTTCLPYAVVVTPILDVRRKLAYDQDNVGITLCFIDFTSKCSGIPLETSTGRCIKSTFNASAN